jgi:hypothetical protein
MARETGSSIAPENAPRIHTSYIRRGVLRTSEHGDRFVRNSFHVRSDRRAFEGLDIMTMMSAAGYGKKRANSGVEKRDTVKIPYKPLKMTATQKRRALKKVRKQEAIQAPRHLLSTRN